jgi:Protein of unknown function (DUF3800)
LELRKVITIAELAPRILPDPARGLLIMLTAYFDESETPNKQSHHFMISGFVSNELGWRSFERKWRHALVCDGFQERGIHWTDLSSGNAAFANLHDEKARTRFQRKYLAIIKGARIQGISSHFDMADFELALPALRKLRKSKTYRLAYYLAFESVMSRTCKLLRAHDLLGDHEKIAFVFDQNKQIEGKAKEIFDNLTTNRPAAFAKHLGTLTFAAARDNLPLQAADALANEFQRDLCRGDTPRRWQFSKLLEGNQVAAFPLRREQLESLARKIDERLGAQD